LLNQSCDKSVGRELSFYANCLREGREGKWREGRKGRGRGQQARVLEVARGVAETAWESKSSSSVVECDWRTQLPGRGYEAMACALKLESGNSCVYFHTWKEEGSTQLVTSPPCIIIHNLSHLGSIGLARDTLVPWPIPH